MTQKNAKSFITKTIPEQENKYMEMSDIAADICSRRNNSHFAREVASDLLWVEDV